MLHLVLMNTLLNFSETCSLLTMCCMSLFVATCCSCIELFGMYTLSQCGYCRLFCARAQLLHRWDANDVGAAHLIAVRKIPYMQSSACPK